MIIIDGPNGRRLVPENTPYRLSPGERIAGSTKLAPTETELEKFAEENKVGMGDLVAKVLDDVGFKEWWDKKHGGECAPCKQRQATLNYIKFKGPEWLSRWVKGESE